MTLYRVLIVAAVVGGGVLTYRVPNGPLLFWWLFSALALGTWVAFSPRAMGLKARAQRLVLLYCVLVSSALVSTQFAARRLTSATHLRFEGVLFERADSVVIASGRSGVDVILPTVSPAQSPWSLTLARRPEGWTFAPGAAVEQVRVSPAVGEPVGRLAELVRVSTGADRYSVLNGVVLDDPADVAVVRGPDGSALDTLAIASRGGTPALRSTRGGYALAPENPRLAARYQRMLRFGTTLGSLDGSRAPSAAFDRFVRVQRLSVREEVNGNVAGWLDWLAASAPVAAVLPTATTRVLVTAAAPFSVDDGAARVEAPVVLPDSVRVEVRHLGGSWRFDVVQTRREPTAELGLAVRFVRNPRPPDSPLPTGDSCIDGVACGLLSLRRLPAPVSHIALDGAGLDPSRFALLARLVDTRDGVKVVLPRDSLMVPRRGPAGARVAAVPVTDLSTLGQPDPGPTVRRRGQWLLLSSSSNYMDDLGVLALVCLGVTGLLFLTAQIVGASAGARATQPTPRERFLALGLNAILALLLTRLTIGARVTFFAPYLPAGLDTAIGLWVAVSVVTLGLLSWSEWAPRFLKLGRAVALQRRPRWSGLSAAARAAFSSDAPGEAARRGRRAFLLLLVPLALLGWVSLGATVFGLICGVTVLSTWFTIAWTAAFSGRTFHSFEEGPFEVIEHQGDGGLSPSERNRGLPEGDVLLLPLLWATTVWQPWLGVMLVLGLSAVRLWTAARRRRAQGGFERELGGLVPVVLGQALSTMGLALLAGVSENGALATFVLVILVALVGVRSGRALAARLTRRGGSAAPTPVPAALPSSAAASGALLPAAIGVVPAPAWTVPGWMMLLYLVAPLLLLLPLAVIDMGLLLVMVIPIGAASVLALGLHRLSRGWKVASALFAASLLFVLVSKVLFPDVRALRSDDPVERADRFEEMQEVFGLRLPVVGASLERAAARAVAARDQQAAEELLVSARPGLARDLLGPSIEQAWASRAYSAAGAGGVGLGAAPIGRGVAEAVSYAENSYAVYVLHEHGVLGGVAVMLAYLTFAVAVTLLVRATPQPTESLRASRAMFLVAALVVTIPAVYVALSNVGVVPITGQNMPFLGLNSWSDVTLCAGVVGILVTGAIRTETGAGRRLGESPGPGGAA